MKARFLHLADCHLGYKQYNRPERFDDFARAFLSIVQVAIDEKVDFVILAGDLFQKRAIDALTLDQAINILTKLKDAGIPCIAIEGNHELSYYDEFLGWVQFLARQELLILLTPRFEDGIPQLTAYNRRRGGAYFEPMPGIRIYGLKYQGASTARIFAAYGEALTAAQESGQNDGVDYTIFLAHTGVEGVLANDSGGLSHRQLAVLKPHVDYLALGHIHKPFEIDGWIYNPGSPETCSFTEAAWPERGYLIVEVDTDAAAQSSDGDEPTLKHSTTLHANPRRPFLRYEVKVDHHRSPEALYDHCQSFLERKARDIGMGEGAKSADGDAPVVQLLLSGVLPFERSELDTRGLEALLHENFHPLHAQVRNLTTVPNPDFTVDERLSRADLERQVLSTLFSQDARFSEESDAWADMAVTLKNLSLSGGDAEAILNSLEQFLAE